MKQFYTKEVSDEVVSSLKSKNYPISQIDMGSTVPQIIELKPTYAEVLDWLIEKGVKISIGNSKTNEWFTMNDKKLNCIRTNNFVDTLDQTILFILDFI